MFNFYTIRKLKDFKLKDGSVIVITKVYGFFSYFFEVEIYINRGDDKPLHIPNRYYRFEAKKFRGIKAQAKIASIIYHNYRLTKVFLVNRDKRYSATEVQSPKEVKETMLEGMRGNL